MRRYEKRQQTHTSEVLVELKCDLCGKIGKHDWNQSCYEINDTIVEVRHEAGSSYPEGGSSTNYVLDICPTCFVNKLIPWFESQGGKVHEIDHDW